MQDKDFINFITSTNLRGGATYNLHTQNVSKQARDILANTPYKALAKQHIANNIVNAYNSNSEFAAKLQDVLTKYNIVLIV